LAVPPVESTFHKLSGLPIGEKGILLETGLELLTPSSERATAIVWEEEPRMAIESVTKKPKSKKHQRLSKKGN